MKHISEYLVKNRINKSDKYEIYSVKSIVPHIKYRQYIVFDSFDKLEEFCGLAGINLTGGIKDNIYNAFGDNENTSIGIRPVDRGGYKIAWNKVTGKDSEKIGYISDPEDFNVKYWKQHGWQV